MSARNKAREKQGMLSEAIRNEIERSIVEFGGKRRAASIDALRIVQHHYGWVSDAALAETAEFLQMSPDDLDSVATFYNLVYRKPVGRHVIHVCNSVSCWATGYNEILAKLESLLGIGYGATTADGRFTLLPIVCLGVCDEGPAIRIDETTHTRLTADNLEAILARYE